MKLLLLVIAVSVGLYSGFSQNVPGKPKELQVYKAKEIEPVKKNTSDKKNEAAEVKSTTALSFFIRKWKTGVTDAFYVVDKGIQGRTMVVNVNTRTLPLYINSDGTYYWEAYGEKRKGKWEKTGKADYPIVLKNAIQNRDWYVGQHNDGKNAIYIWDNNAISYTGIPL